MENGKIFATNMNNNNLNIKANKFKTYSIGFFSITSSTNLIAIYLRCLIILCAFIIYCRAWDIENNYNIRVNDHGFELTQANNLQRQEMVQRFCETLPTTPAANTNDANLLKNIPDDQLDHLLIDPKHKFLYCYVPKVACTNWKRILMLMTEQWPNGTDPLKIPASIAHTPGM